MPVRVNQNLRPSYEVTFICIHFLPSVLAKWTGHMAIDHTGGSSRSVEKTFRELLLIMRYGMF
jgi:hypothetical protein